MSLIRKISVGTEFPNKVMHWQVGQQKYLDNREYVIHSIERAVEYGTVVYRIYIKDEHSILLWKTIQDMPVVVEQLVNFD